MTVPRAVELQASRPDGKQRSAILIAGAVLITIVLVGVAVGLVLLLQDGKEEETAPADTGPLDQIDEILEIPTLIEGIATSLPIPTQLEELATEMPIPTDLEEMATSLPIPTQIQELMTAVPELPALPPATPPPLVGAAPPGSQGAGQ